ncbi:MAG: hypothetical protein Q4E62_07430 [Sutterellaceae bacterium]|nr:hypothetical protein [Sutterellaceae bacterium]
MCNTIEAKVAAVSAAVDEALDSIRYPEGFPLSTFKAVETVADACGWEVSPDNDDDGQFKLTFSFTEGDNSFDFKVETLDQLVDAVKDCYDNYDPSYEAYLWLDQWGHGRNGAPDSMRGVLEEAEEVQSGLEDLWIYLTQLQSGSFQLKDAPDGFTKDDLSEIRQIATWIASNVSFNFEWLRNTGSFSFKYKGAIKAELIYPAYKIKSIDDLIKEIENSLEAVRAWLATKADLPIKTSEAVSFVSRHVSDYADDLGRLRDSLAKFAKTSQAVQDSAQ